MSNYSRKKDVIWVNFDEVEKDKIGIVYAIV